MILFTGCVLTQWSEIAQKRAAAAGAAPAAGEQELHKSWGVGIALVLVMTLFSGCAGVWNEALLKRDASIHYSNLQLYFYGMLLNGGALVVRAGGLAPSELLRGFNGWAWAIVLMMSTLGLSIAAVMKYLDSVVKIMCTAASMVFTYALSVRMFGAALSASFVAGGALVFFALYTYEPPRQQQQATK